MMTSGAFVAALCVAFLCRGSAAFQMKTSSAGNQRRSVFDGSYVFDSEGAYEWSDFVQARNEHDRKLTDMDQMNCALSGECPVPESFLGGPTAEKQYNLRAAPMREYTVFTAGGDFERSCSRDVCQELQGDSKSFL
mmetsp:Transcript_32022/g.55701  ORF Transcript_32022/g.55701 Transcript_32022/m.55701 type:complete len:136 (-) Transcript_32022:374-781(-)